MIDPETGYTTDLVCECRPCQRCNGEGGWFLTTRDRHGLDILTDLYATCPDCKGSGSFDGDCSVHCTWEPARISWKSTI